MNMLTTMSNGDLLHQLRRQYPGATTTWSRCAAGCKTSARGGGHCADCLSKELARRGLSDESLKTLRRLFQWQGNASAAIEQALAGVHAELEGKKK